MNDITHLIKGFNFIGRYSCNNNKVYNTITLLKHLPKHIIKVSTEIVKSKNSIKPITNADSTRTMPMLQLLFRCPELKIQNGAKLGTLQILAKLSMITIPVPYQ